jgi:hypothetical protein
MRSEAVSLDVHDGLADGLGKAEKAIQQEQFNTFSEQQPTLASYQQENVDRFKGADNPYAAALADVFGLEA